VPVLKISYVGYIRLIARDKKRYMDFSKITALTNVFNAISKIEKGTNPWIHHRFMPFNCKKSLLL
jgi:hypothetical protein